MPADPVQRAEWIQRAGVAAAYREERGYADEVDAIGPAPQRGSPEQRASWHAAFTALRMPEEGREVAAMADGELWARRAAYARETAWAPPYVADELRDAHLAEDKYRADAVLAWHRADAAADEAERAGALREAEEDSALAQEVGGYREALSEVAEARRRWHAVTELDRQRAVVADAELRRRYPDADLPPLHPAEEQVTSAPAHEAGEPDSAYQPWRLDHAALETSGAGTSSGHLDPDAQAAAAGEAAGPPERDLADRPTPVRRDITAALNAARRAERIIAERELRADREAGLDSDDVMRRREADARHEAVARRSAVRQNPAPSRLAAQRELQEPELELEAGL